MKLGLKKLENQASKVNQKTEPINLVPDVLDPALAEAQRKKTSSHSPGDDRKATARQEWMLVFAMLPVREEWPARFGVVRRKNFEQPHALTQVFIKIGGQHTVIIQA